MNYETLKQQLYNCIDHLKDLNNIQYQYLKNWFQYITNDQNSIQYKFTDITILLESFYQFSKSSNFIKTDLLALRLERWQNHFGVPTLKFLISFSKLIEKNISNLINMEIKVPSTLKTLKSRLAEDEINGVLVNDYQLLPVTMPKENEKKGELLLTHNPIGGFTTAPNDPYTISFIDEVISSTKALNILEIGAAFGVVSLELLSPNVTNYCNDIEASNLAVIHNRYNLKYNANSEISGDYKDTIFLPGAFPEELTFLPCDYFDAILISRVLHFFSGEQIVKSLNLLKKLLRRKGKLFIICETPYMKNWSSFIEIYKRRVLEGCEWPGEIREPNVFETSGRAKNLPHLVHWFTPEVLNNALTQVGFKIEKSSFFSREGQFPDDLLLDGRESVGIIAIN